MLTFYLNINLYIYWLLVLSHSLSFGQSFINQQKPQYHLLKWEEISNEKIVFSKISPILYHDTNLSRIVSFDYSSFTKDKIINSETFAMFSLESPWNDNSDNAFNERYHFYGQIQVNLSEKLIIQNEYEFDSKGLSDPHFSGIERGAKNGWVGYLQSSSLNYFYSNGNLSIGRGNPYYFNMNQSLFLNAAFPPVEFVLWNHKIRLSSIGPQKLEYNWGLLMLSDNELYNRYLTFHRYGIKNKNFRVGFSEAVIVTYTNWGSEEIRYLMPANVMLEAEANGSTNSNLIWLIDGMAKWDQNTIYTEILIDDFAVDGKSPPQVAVSLGLGKKYNNLMLNIEYARINRWTGNYCDKALNKAFIEKNVPIGHLMGSDAHQFIFSTHYIINKKINIESSLILLESGEGSAQDRLLEWPDDIVCDQNFGYGSEKFPSSINKSLLGDLNLYYRLRDKLLINAQLLFNNGNYPQFIMTLSYKNNL